jgi:hypothetical protein
MRNLDDTSDLYLEHCGVWIHCMGVALVRTNAFGPAVTSAIRIPRRWCANMRHACCVP